MFGFVKKEDVVTMVNREVELMRSMHEKYTDLLRTHSVHIEEGECYRREAQRCKEMTDEYFARYMEAKEILKKVQDM